MTARKLTAILFAIILTLSLLLTGCGAKREALGDYETGSSSLFNRVSGNFADEDAPSSPEKEISGDEKSSGEVAQGRKIIENVNLTVQTKEYDKLISTLEEKVKEIGGYIERSSSYGADYYGYNNRRSEYVFRVPSAKGDSFVDFIGTAGTITRKSIDTDDVTLKYVDIESRVSSLEKERAKLEELMDTTKDISSIISIQDRISSLTYQIESYKSSLLTYDNLVDYTTVTVSVQEVERVDNTSKVGVFERIGINLKDGFENVWKALKAIFVFLISAIPYLIPFAVLAFIVVLIIKLSIKRSRKKKAKKNAQQ